MKQKNLTLEAEIEVQAGLLARDYLDYIPEEKRASLLHDLHQFARFIVAWYSKRVAAYIRECLAPEESLFDTCPEDYTKCKIRGYKDILRDLEDGGLDRYMDKKAAEEKEALTCRNCEHRERWQMGGRVIQYCGARRSSRTLNGLRKIKVTDKACALYKEDEK